jgi:hypothetical protein
MCFIAKHIEERNKVKEGKKLKVKKNQETEGTYVLPVTHAKSEVWLMLMK